MKPRLLDWEVWTLHLAFAEAEAASQVSFYSPSADAVDAICEYTEVNEGVLALDLILAAATPAVPALLRERAYQVATLYSPEEPEAEVKAYVDGWLAWSLGSGTEPPHWT